MDTPPSILETHWQWAGQTLRRLTREVPPLLDMVAWGDAATVQFIAAVLAERLRPAHQFPVTWGRKLAHHPRDAVLEEIHGASAAHLPPALARLGLDIAPRETYSALAALVGQPANRRLILQRKRLDPGFIALLRSGAARFLHPELFADQKPIDARFVTAFRIALRKRLMRGPEAIEERLQVLRRIRRWDELQDWLLEASDPAVPLPVPRWPGDTYLQPVRDLGEVLALARRHRNCLAERALDYLRGWHALYRSTSDPSVLVEIGHGLDGALYLSQMEIGAKGRLKHETRRMVEHRLEQAGIQVHDATSPSCRPQAIVRALRGASDEIEVLHIADLG